MVFQTRLVGCEAAALEVLDAGQLRVELAVVPAVEHPHIVAPDHERLLVARAGVGEGGGGRRCGQGFGVRDKKRQLVCWFEDAFCLERTTCNLN